MNLENLKIEIEKDVKINPTALDVASLDIATITVKYLKVRTDENILLRILERKYKTLYREAWEYYGGKATDEVYQARPFPLKVLKNDLPTYLDSDEDLLNIKDKIDIKKEKIKLIDSMIGIMNQRSFNISSAIRWQEFINGGK